MMNTPQKNRMGETRKAVVREMESRDRKPE